MPAALNEMEQQILDYMVRYLKANTYQPSIREIGEEFGIRSTKTVSEHLHALADKGFLVRDPTRSRAVRILNLDLSSRTTTVPCFPDFPPLDRTWPTDGAETLFEVDRRLAGAQGAYFVRVDNDARSSWGIPRGALLLVEPVEATDFEHGDLLVADLGQGPELCRVERQESSLGLRPLLEGAAPITVEVPDRLRVGGRVTALYRRFDEAPVSVVDRNH